MDIYFTLSFFISLATYSYFRCIRLECNTLFNTHMKTHKKTQEHTRTHKNIQEHTRTHIQTRDQTHKRDKTNYISFTAMKTTVVNVNFSLSSMIPQGSIFFVKGIPPWTAPRTIPTSINYQR